MKSNSSNFGVSIEDSNVDFREKSALVNAVFERLQKREYLKSIFIASFDSCEDTFECEGDIDPSCGQNSNAEYHDHNGKALCDRSGATYTACESNVHVCRRKFACGKSIFDCGRFTCLSQIRLYACQTISSFRCSGLRFDCDINTAFQCLSFDKYHCTNDFRCGDTNRRFNCSAGLGTGKKGSFSCGFAPIDGKERADSADKFYCNADNAAFSCISTADFTCEKSTLFWCTSKSKGDFDCTSDEFKCEDRYDCYPDNKVLCNGTNSNTQYDCPASYSICASDMQKECKHIYVCLPDNSCIRPTPFVCPSPTPYSPPPKP
ncbi:MAG: hypothetical protein LBC74_00875 [Planctomycetaceae bacterium]|jgi:hypothetical protein|nr:hypothetical protein [Planctomycetaceae bacterium]